MIKSQRCPECDSEMRPLMIGRDGQWYRCKVCNFEICVED